MLDVLRLPADVLAPDGPGYIYFFLDVIRRARVSQFGLLRVGKEKYLVQNTYQVQALCWACTVCYLLDFILQASWVALALLLPPLQMRKPRLQVNKCPVHTCPVPQPPLSTCLYLAGCAGRGALSLNLCCSPYKHREWVCKGSFLTST